MRRGLRALAAGGLGLAVSLLAACGSSSGLLSSTDASSLSSQIQLVTADVNSGNCSAVPNDLGKLQADLSNLPSSVDASLRSALDQGVARVRSLALQKCPSSPAPASTTTNTTTTTAPPTTTTATTPTHTTTTPTTSTATTPANTGTTSTGPNSGGSGSGGTGFGDGGGGNGNGNGNGHGD